MQRNSYCSLKAPSFSSWLEILTLKCIIHRLQQTSASGPKNTWHGWQAGNSTSEAWEALNKTLKAIDLAALSFSSNGLNWKQGLP